MHLAGTAVPPPTWLHALLRRVALEGLALIALGTAIALFLSAVFGQDLWRTWQYTMFITVG